jgi:hypothetical protein
MLLFIVIPIALVFKEHYAFSFVVFAFMIPYGWFIRFLAVRVVRRRLADHPNQVQQFEEEGIISWPGGSAGRPASRIAGSERSG